METLPSDIQALIQEKKLQVAAEKLRDIVIEAVAARDYDTAIDVQIRRSTLLKAQGDDTGALQALDEALVWAHQAKDHQRAARLMEMRLVFELTGKGSKQDPVTAVREIIQVYQAAQDPGEQLKALVAFAAIIAPIESEKAMALLDEADVLLNATDPERLEAMPAQSLIMLYPSLHVHHTPQVNDVKDQWRTYINQVRQFIARLRV